MRVSLRDAVMDRVRDVHGEQLGPVMGTVLETVEAWLGPRPSKWHTCGHCGRLIDIEDTHVERDKGLYCSMACAMRSAPPAVPAPVGVYVGDGHPAIRRAEDVSGRYEPTEDPE